jgi:hypothetical protein
MKENRQEQDRFIRVERVYLKHGLRGMFRDYQYQVVTGGYLRLMRRLMSSIQRRGKQPAITLQDILSIWLIRNLPVWFSRLCWLLRM